MPLPAMLFLLVLATGVASGAVSTKGVDLHKLSQGQAVYIVNN